MRFSEYFGLTKTASDDWFDLLLNQDTPLYIDPFLIFAHDDNPLWAGARDELVHYYETVLTHVIASTGVESSLAWDAAVRMLMCPEPNEFALGLSLGDPRGSGVGAKLAVEMARTLNLVGHSGALELASIAGFAIFVKGMGPDLISDTLCNILKSRFVAYTEEVAERLDLPTRRLMVKNLRWDKRRGGWQSGLVRLPYNPYLKSPVVLCPDGFLQDIPVLAPGEFWDSVDVGSEMRLQLNLELSESLSGSEKLAAARAIAMREPDVAIAFLREFNASHHAVAYDVAGDPKGLVTWYEQGRRLAAQAPRIDAPTKEIDVPSFVLKLAYAFKEEVEDREAWRVLWNKSKTEHQLEEVAQALAGVVWRSQCEAANVDLNREVNIGRGPVDFKFSQGWVSRALLEVKHVGSSRFFSGAEKQVPQYLKSEKIAFAVYLAIGYSDPDCAPDRWKTIEDTCRVLERELAITVTPVFVDARPRTKVSASRQH